MLVSTIKNKSKIVLEEVRSMLSDSSIGMEQILFAENLDAYPDPEDDSYYNDSYSIILDIGNASYSKTMLDNFNLFLQKELGVSGILAFDKSYLEMSIEAGTDDNNRYQYMLDTAIAIEVLNPDKSLQEQFKAQKEKCQNLEQRSKRIRIESPEQSPLLPQALQLRVKEGAEVEISAEEAQKIQNENSQFAKAMTMLLQDKRVIIPTEVRQQLQKHFPNLIASQQLVK
jgi:hypothetical protein